MIYSLMCGKNGTELTENEFLAGCNRFGLDNPTPIICSRIAPYGNEDNMEQLITRLAKQHSFLDPEKFTGQNPDKSNKINWDEFDGTAQDGMPHKAERLNCRDMHETQVSRHKGKKWSGVHDIKMLDRLDNAKKFKSPAHEITARSFKINIKDIPRNTTLRGKAVGYNRDTNTEHDLYSNKEILVPSFGATGALFAKHFDILDKLKRRITLIKQAHINQSDEDVAWEQVDLIIKTLERGIKFLDFDAPAP